MSPSIQLRTGYHQATGGLESSEVDSWQQSKYFHDGSKRKKRVTDKECIREIEKAVSNQKARSVIQFSSVRARKHMLKKNSAQFIDI